MPSLDSHRYGRSVPSVTNIYFNVTGSAATCTSARASVRIAIRVEPKLVANLFIIVFFYPTVVLPLLPPLLRLCRSGKPLLERTLRVLACKDSAAMLLCLLPRRRLRGLRGHRRGAPSSATRGRYRQ